jgi:hypothetical protein
VQGLEQALIDRRGLGIGVGGYSQRKQKARERAACYQSGTKKSHVTPSAIAWLILPQEGLPCHRPEAINSRIACLL